MYPFTKTKPIQPWRAHQTDDMIDFLFRGEAPRPKVPIFLWSSIYISTLFLTADWDVIPPGSSVARYWALSVTHFCEIATLSGYWVLLERIPYTTYTARYTGCLPRLRRAFVWFSKYRMTRYFHRLFITPSVQIDFLCRNTMLPHGHKLQRNGETDNASHEHWNTRTAI